MTIKLLSLFSGIGAFEKALSKIKVDYELVNYCEIDKFASKAYSLIHNVPPDKNLGDIKQIDAKKLEDFDLMTWGFPCQDFCLANPKRNGLDGTRSSLYYYGLQILREKKPKYSVIENTKDLTDGKFQLQFWRILRDIAEAGYTNYYAVLNAKDYGIPQQRKRVFIVSIRNDLEQEFEFPQPIGCTKWFKDYLENDIPEQYLLSANEQNYMDRKTKDGRNHWDFNHHHDTDNQFSHVLPANLYKGVPYNVLADKRNGVIYRKLMPIEVFRLMGFDDVDCQILEQNNISKTQIYKMAGNSIVVNVLEGIFINLLKESGQS